MSKLLVKENAIQWFAKRRLRRYTNSPQKNSSIKGIHLKGQHKLNKRHAKWMKFIKKFLYVIKFKKDSTNIVAGALYKRYAIFSKLGAQILGFENIPELYEKDPYFAPTFASCKHKA